MVQVIFGGEIIKGATKGASKGTRFTKNIQPGAKVEQEVVGGR